MSDVPAIQIVRVTHLRVCEGGHVVEAVETDEYLPLERCGHCGEKTWADAESHFCVWCGVALDPSGAVGS